MIYSYGYEKQYRRTHGMDILPCLRKSQPPAKPVVVILQNFREVMVFMNLCHGRVFASEPFGSTVTTLNSNTNLKNVYKYKNLSNVKKMFTTLKNGAMMLIK